MTFRPQAIDGGKAVQGQFVCPWCGSTFSRRSIASDGAYSLEEHWQAARQCGRNRNVNSQTQAKYNILEDGE